MMCHGECGRAPLLRHPDAGAGGHRPCRLTVGQPSIDRCRALSVIIRAKGRRVDAPQAKGAVKMSLTYRAQTPKGEVVTTDRQLAEFKELYIGGRPFFKRVSDLFVFDLYVYDVAFGVSSMDVIDTIRALEGEAVRVPETKPASEFRQLPLAGLWHKHYFSAHFVTQNIINGLGKNGLEKLIAEVMDPAKSPIITKEMISELSHRVIHDPLDSRSSAGRLTGEWIVYLPHAGENYYLCLNTHDAGDQAIYDRITQHCVRDFPELPRWLATAQAHP